MTPEAEEKIVHQLITFEELVKHLATKEALQKVQTKLIVWIICTNLAIGGGLLGVMIYLHNDMVNQFRFILEHWKP